MLINTRRVSITRSLRSLGIENSTRIEKCHFADFVKIVIVLFSVIFNLIFELLNKFKTPSEPHLILYYGFVNGCMAQKDLIFDGSTYEKKLEVAHAYFSL